MSSTGSGKDRNPPRSDELEISLFGPGYGESLAVHMGNRRWMIVDSCIDPDSRRPAALDYLDRLEVDCANEVVLVLATHWHDDHVRGLADVVEACKGARFLCPASVRSEEFLVLTQSNVLGSGQITSGVREFARVLEIVRSRRAMGQSDAGPGLVVENTVVGDSPQCTVKALSPSSAALEHAMAAIAGMLPQPLRPHLRVHPAAAGRAGLVKLPHHGSESGHDQRMWDELLEREPAAMLTPWRRGARSLPTEADRRRLVGLAPGAVLVGGGESRLGRYDRAVERTLKEVAESRSGATGRMGHARARCGPADSGSWRLELGSNAQPMAAAA